MTDYRYIIVGSGIAGLYAALLAQAAGSVLVVTKDRPAESNTLYAQGGIAAPVGPDDDPALHLQDTLAAGAGLVDERAARVLTAEARERIAHLMALGVPFDRTNGHVALAREGAHTVARVLHAGGDATGRNIAAVLLAHVSRSDRVTLLEEQMLTDLLVAQGRVQGIEVLDCRTGRRRQFTGQHIILATGGAGRLFARTTNPPVATGDGLAAAFRAGAALADLEFFQFHPTALALPGAPAFLISEAVRGEGAVLRNAAGEPFLRRLDPRGELAPRDIVARAIFQEMARTGQPCVYLDLTHLPADRVRQRFPTIAQVCARYGLEITTTPIPVAPAAHYYMGGVWTDTWGRTTLPGLYACGEVACTGVHGANRLASNSLLEGLVFAARAITASLRPVPPEDPPALPAEWLAVPPLETAASEPPDRAALQTLLWEKAGLVRTGPDLAAAYGRLTAWQAALAGRPPQTRADCELANLVLVGRLLVLAAWRRTESRGAHYRADYPATDPAWRRRQVWTVAPVEVDRGVPVDCGAGGG
mgnify:FL=1